MSGGRMREAWKKDGGRDASGHAARIDTKETRRRGETKTTDGKKKPAAYGGRKSPQQHAAYKWCQVMIFFLSFPLFLLCLYCWFFLKLRGIKGQMGNRRISTSRKYLTTHYFFCLFPTISSLFILLYWFFVGSCQFWIGWDLFFVLF